jgi:3-deoxy-D-manno-octulosonate 8-phosphate phosphatase (KDO 8-P phosphatase)
MNFKEIKMFIMDVDGTLTDGKIHISNSGEIFKSFNVKDGLGIKKLQEKNIIPVIITGRKSEIVKNRAKELDIKEVYQGIKEKKEILKKLIKKYNITKDNVAYIGDDLNDLDIMKEVKFKFTVNNGIEELKKISDFISSKDGGEGAVREVVEYILYNRGD